MALARLWIRPRSGKDHAVVVWGLGALYDHPHGHSGRRPLMNNHQLARWLMREIHGVDLPRRKPMKKALSLGSKPARSWKYRGWIRSLPCTVCGLDPAGEAAHTGSDGGMRQKSSDYSCITLCTDCHTQSATSYHRLGKAAFELRHNLDLADLARRLNRL